MAVFVYAHRRLDQFLEAMFPPWLGRFLVVLEVVFAIAIAALILNMVFDFAGIFIPKVRDLHERYVGRNN